MTAFLEKLKPAVGKRSLIVLSGLFWIVAGGILLRYAWRMLSGDHGVALVSTLGAGFAAALVIHHFGFLKVVDRNLGRITSLRDRTCAFAFQSWRSYLVVAVMMGMGIAIRHSPLPKRYVATLYVAIGSALVLSSVRYLRLGLKAKT